MMNTFNNSLQPQEVEAGASHCPSQPRIHSEILSLNKWLGGGQADKELVIEKDWVGDMAEWKSTFLACVRS